MTARPIYRIVDWEQYEPPGVDSLRPLPELLLPVNSLTIWRAYDELRVLRNGAALFGVYVAMLRVAARCFPRGILINGNGAGMSPQRLAELTELRYSAWHVAIPAFVELGLLEEVSAAEVADLADQLTPHVKPPRIPRRISKKR